MIKFFKLLNSYPHELFSKKVFFNHFKDYPKIAYCWWFVLKREAYKTHYVHDGVLYKQFSQYLDANVANLSGFKIFKYPLKETDEILYFTERSILDLFCDKKRKQNGKS